MILEDFFVIEGLDGCGKTTLTKSLVHAIPNVVSSMQPSPGPFGVKIREVLQSKVGLEPTDLLNLFIEDRKWHESWIVEQIQKEKHKVILDRYVLSTIAYQGLYFQREEIWELNKFFKIPQIIFFIDLPPDLALERKRKQNMQKGHSQELFEVKELQKKIWNNYQKGIAYLSDKGYHIIRLNGELSEEQLLTEALKYLQ